MFNASCDGHCKKEYIPPLIDRLSLPLVFVCSFSFCGRMKKQEVRECFNADQLTLLAQQADQIAQQDAQQEAHTHTQTKKEPDQSGSSRIAAKRQKVA